jgi:ATP-dependent DNA helicase RecG
MAKLTLASPVKFLKGVGPKRAEALQRLGIRTMGDLLYHVPHRYLDATTVTPLARANVNQEVTCVGRVVSTGVLPTRRGLRVFRAVLKDESGLLECAWPGRPFLERQIKKGQLLLVTGPVRYYHGKQLVPREFIVLAEPDDASDGDPGLVLPVYPATEGLTHRQIRVLVQQHLDGLLPLVTDPHPPAFRATHHLIELRRALEVMHRPKKVEDAELGRRRLAFDELFDQQLVQARAPSGKARSSGHHIRVTATTHHKTQRASAI